MVDITIGDVYSLGIVLGLVLVVAAIYDIVEWSLKRRWSEKRRKKF